MTGVGESVRRTEIIPHRLAVRRFWPELGLAVALIFISMTSPHLILGHDQVWQLWIGRQLGHGVNLYDQIMEVNPPLWFWIAVPLTRIAQASGISDGVVLKGFLVAALAMAATLLAVLWRGRPARERAFVYLGLLLAGFGLVLREFAQREHYALIASIPYIALMARRGSNAPVRRDLALGVGLFAATGFALKPYFALVPLLLELWLLATVRREWRPWRPEVFALAGCAAAYAWAVLVFEPDYLRVMVPDLALAYHGYKAPLRALVAGNAMPWAAATAGAVLLRRGLHSPLAAAALAAAGGFLVVYFIQGMGWRYHALPVTGLMAFALLAEVSRVRWRGAGLPAVAGAAVMVSILAVLTWEAAVGGLYLSAYRRPTEAALAGLRPGEVVMTFSWHASSSWPMLQERGLVWPSRHYTFWMLPEIAAARASGKRDAALEAYGARVRAQTAEDLRCHPPARILVDDPRHSRLYRGGGFGFIRFFREDPGLAAFLEQYRPVRSIYLWTVYEPVGARPVPTGAGCRRVF